MSVALSLRGFKKKRFCDSGPSRRTQGPQAAQGRSSRRCTADGRGCTPKDTGCSCVRWAGEGYAVSLCRSTHSHSHARALWSPVLTEFPSCERRARIGEAPTAKRAAVQRASLWWEIRVCLCRKLESADAPSLLPLRALQSSDQIGGREPRARREGAAGTESGSGTQTIAGPCMHGDHDHHSRPDPTKTSWARTPDSGAVNATALGLGIVADTASLRFVVSCVVFAWI